ncbi:competence pheromone ComX [Lysinibacillus sp. NPDC056232]|uniref:competence pheromone ComX n=1 Tax=unclassified Lysinibacillus TaxID=2636778 RepID=UPI0035DE1CE2
MLKIIQYLQKNEEILALFKEGKVSLLNISPLESSLILESFDNAVKPSLRDSYQLYWRA